MSAPHAKFGQAGQGWLKAEWTKSAIRRSLGLELPSGFRADHHLLQTLGLGELSQKILDADVSSDSLHTPVKDIQNRFGDSPRMRGSFENLRHDPLNGYPSLRYESSDPYSGSQLADYPTMESGNASKNWLSEWVLPLLFTLLTLACLALLAAETLAPTMAPSPRTAKANLSENRSLTPSPIIISAFSG